MLKEINQVRYELEQFNKDFHWWDESLAGACLIGSYLLASKVNGVLYSGKVNGVDHCWVETDTELIDITYSQFNYNEKVLILKKDGSEYQNYQVSSKIKHLLSEEFNNWQLFQKPSFYLKQRAKLYKVA